MAISEQAEEVDQRVEPFGEETGEMTEQQMVVLP